MDSSYNYKNFSLSSKDVNKEEIEIDLRQVFTVFIARWYLIVLAAVIVSVIVFGYFNFAVVPRYTATTNIMVINRQNEGTVSSSDLSSSTTLSSDYVQIIKNVSVVGKVIDNLGINTTVGNLTNRITATNISGTRMISISVEDEDPQLAMKIANEMAKVSADKICDVMNIENMVSIVNEAQLPSSPSYPSTLKYTAIAFILTFILMWAILFLIFMLDDKIKSAEDVEKYLGVPVLALIPFDDHATTENGKKSGKKSSQKTSKKSSEKAAAPKANADKAIKSEEKAIIEEQKKSAPETPAPQAEEAQTKRPLVANQPQRRKPVQATQQPQRQPVQAQAPAQVQKQPPMGSGNSSRIKMVEIVDMDFDDTEA